jgi:hypothetical protein
MSEIQGLDFILVFTALTGLGWPRVGFACLGVFVVADMLLR